MSRVKVERYAAYKESGVEWLGEVPKHWTVTRIKEFSNIVNGATPKSNVAQNWYGDLPWVTTDDLGKLRGKFITETKRKLTEIGYASCGTTICPVGSVVISGRAPIGHLGILAIEASTNQGCKTLIINHRCASDVFIFFSLLAAKSKLEALGRGTTFIELSTKELGLFSLAFPPFEEQTAIAAYLDSKTAQIDRKIDLLSQKATQYAKLKQSLINETVTRGLDKSVPMKDSGVEWIGKIPQHWRICRVKNLAKSTNGGAFKDDLVDEGLPIIKIQQLTINCNAIEFCSPESPKLKPGNLLKDGDLVFSWSTLIAPFIYKGKNAVLNQHIFKISHSRYVHRSWLYYKLYQSKSRLLVFAHGSTMQHILKSDFDNLEMEIPPFSEQTAIATYLDQKTTQIDRIVSNINQQIDQLTDCRKALINDVVTGKMKVLNAEYAT